MKTAYVVTSGSYSDYSIRAVFDDEALAQAFVAAYNGSGPYEDAEIEQWPMNEHQVKDGDRCWFVRMKKDGEVVSAEPGSGDSQGMGEDIHGNLYCDVFADTLERAIKVANERRTAWVLAND